MAVFDPKSQAPGSRFDPRIASALDQDAALRNPPQQIQPKKANGCSAYGSARHNLSGFESKVVVPPIPPWMEQRADSVHFKTEAGDIGTLPRVAADASEGKVVRRGITAVLSTNDVIDLMWRERIVFMKQAILAMPSRAAGDE